MNKRKFSFTINRFNTMVNFHKYMPTSPIDERWGLHVLNIGYNNIESLQPYPSPNHPEHHYFNWQTGRVLSEFQIIYIPSGSGTFESSSCGKLNIKEGSVILLFPGEWHRFKPDFNSGWEEYWVGFKGLFMDHLLKQQFIHKNKAVLHVGLSEKLIQLYLDLIEITQAERAGYQPLVSGIVIHLLGQIHALVINKIYAHQQPTQSVINKAIIYFRTHVEDNVSIEKLAAQLNVSYAWFRKAFKAYTGISPHHYLLQLKIEKAKRLLNNPSLTIKQIAYQLSFESPYYFTNLFRKKTGQSPSKYRLNTKQ